MSNETLTATEPAEDVLTVIVPDNTLDRNREIAVDLGMHVRKILHAAWCEGRDAAAEEAKLWINRMCHSDFERNISALKSPYEETVNDTD